MAKTVIIWASAHEITAQQRAELEAMGELKFLNQINPELFQQMTKLEYNSKRLDIVSELLQTAWDENASVIVQPAGDPALHTTLGVELGARLSAPTILFSFSKRESVDTPQPDGSIVKTSVFNHKGWITS